jgi:hypothetical protein
MHITAKTGFLSAAWSYFTKWSVAATREGYNIKYVAHVEEFHGEACSIHDHESSLSCILLNIISA